MSVDAERRGRRRRRMKKEKHSVDKSNFLVKCRGVTVRAYKYEGNASIGRTQSKCTKAARHVTTCDEQTHGGASV